LHQLSEAAANASIYVLVNIVELEKCNKSQECSNDGVNLYNTNIVFDRTGCIVSSYRKYNLFQEPNMNETLEPVIATFDTDFDVKFGHFICFDLLFKAPAYDMVNSNITHILYPSSWYSEVPFLTSVQIQQNYAYANNIVLLSAGANFPANSNTGSGIFVGRHGAIKSLISYRNESKMMIAKIPKDINDESYGPTEIDNEEYTTIEMESLNLWSNPPQFLYPLQDSLTVNHGNLECTFSVNFTQLSDSGYSHISYSFTAFHGPRNYANVVNGGEIYCSIVACVKEDDVKSCGTKIESSKIIVPSVLFHSINIEAKIHVNGNSDDFLMMPTTLNFNIHSLNVSNFEFNSVNEMKFEMKSLKPLSNLMTFGIFGRDFSIDSKESEIFDEEVLFSTLKSDAMLEKIEIEQADVNVDYDIAIKMTIYVCLMVVLCIIAAFLVYRRLQKPYEHPVIAMRRKSEMNFSPN
jgi:pantetheine hydrolase